MDAALAIVLDMCRMDYGASLRPLRIDLLRPRPANAEVYRAFYGCTVNFASARRALVLRRADTEQPLPTSNRQLAQVHGRVIAEELARLDRADVLARCKATLLEKMHSGELSEDFMAKRLHMSRRTLQRKLTDRDTTYQKLVDDTRRDLALRFIEDPRRSLGDITFELGFSQQSALTRAFRRWTGKSPTDWRQRQHAAR